MSSISLIIPVYNREEEIKRALNSAFNQTLRADEIIVVDDGSSDLTPNILQSFKDKVRIITTQNGGVSRARNIGIKASKGEWITFLDSDDEWMSSKLQKQMRFHQKNPHILFSHTNERWIRSGRKVKQKAIHKKPSGWCFRQNLNFCKIAPSSVMVHKSVLDRVGLFDESLEVCEDYDLWLRVSREFEVGLVEEELVIKYGGHKDQLSFKHHSIDRFRVEALLKHRDLKEVQDEIERKCKILINGAKKRGNLEVVNHYQSILIDLSL